MATKRKLPPRYKSGPKKGQFKPKSARRRTTSKKKTTTRKRTTTRRNPGRTVRKNPPAMFGGDIVGTLMDASVEAGQILVGKAAVRSIPDMMGAPRAGNIGLAVQAATALAIGWVGSMFLSPNAARALTAGGLTAPLETLIVATEVPWLSRALGPGASNNDLGAYVQAARPSLMVSNGGNGKAAGMGAYVPRRPRRTGIGSYGTGSGG